MIDQTTSNPPLRVLYAAGPGNVIRTYRDWKAGQEDQTQFSVTYSSQFYSLCRELGIQGYIVSSHFDQQRISDGQFTLEHRPKKLGLSGVSYHLNEIGYGLRLVRSAFKFRADFAIVDSGTTHWFVLALLSWLGIKVIPSLHCVLWRQYVPRRRVEKVLLSLNRHLFQQNSHAVLAVSRDIAAQVRELAGEQASPIQPFLPLYQRHLFTAIQAPNFEQDGFRVLYAGRIETDKGVFDLLDMAQRLTARGYSQVYFDLCGTGSALEALKTAAAAAGMTDRFICHGHCNQTKMQSLLNQSHVVVVPTRKDFVEGFNQVVAEGVLAGRPVITSAVCPAIAYVAPAVVEVPPEDMEAYVRAIERLCSDRTFYEMKHQGTYSVREQFFQVNHSWGAALKEILTSSEYKIELETQQLAI